MERPILLLLAIGVFGGMLAYYLPRWIKGSVMKLPTISPSALNRFSIGVSATAIFMSLASVALQKIQGRMDFDVVDMLYCLTPVGAIVFGGVVWWASRFLMKNRSR